MVKITKQQLRKIIKEEISKELEEGPKDFMKKMMGPRDQGRTPETDWTVTLTNKAGKSGSWRTITVGAHSEEEAAQKAKAQMDDHETVSRVEKALGEAKEEKFLQNIKSTGEWTDYTIGELEKKKAALMKKKKRTADEIKTVRQLNFAINAKQGDYQ